MLHAFSSSFHINTTPPTAFQACSCSCLLPLEDTGHLIWKNISLGAKLNTRADVFRIWYSSVGFKCRIPSLRLSSMYTNNSSSPFSSFFVNKDTLKSRFYGDSTLK